MEAKYNLGLAFQDLSAQNVKQNPEQAHSYATLAIEAFEAITTTGNAGPLVYYNLGFLYRQRGLLAQAKEVWEKAIDLGLDQDRSTELSKLIHELDRLDIVEAQFENGVTAINEGRFKVGITLLEPLAKRYPHWWQVSFQLGMAYRNIEDYEKAIEIFDKTINSNPAMPEVYSQKGLCKYALGKMDEAETLLHKALSLNPEDAGYLGNLGLVYLRQKRYQEAADTFYQAKQKSPDDALILHYIQELPREYQRENV
jgi:tetratricopeptide (TPR) repeat protein